MGFSTFTGNYQYFFESYVQTYHANDQYSGAFGSSVLDATLTGIDEVDQYGNLRDRAVFDEFGNATISATPEPASLVLFASGLCVVRCFVRRRRKA